MPILFNFHILMATFYIIFGTNILIQCPVPVPVCCMFLVSQNIHIKRSPNGIKTDGDTFGIFGKFQKKNPCETVPEVVTRQGARLPPGRAACLVGPLVLHRPQLQLYIFTFGEIKNQREGFIAFYDTEPPPSPNLSREG